MKPLLGWLGGLLRWNRKFASAAGLFSETGLVRAPRAVNELVASNALFTLAYYARFVCLVHTRSRTRLQASIEVDGRERIEAAVAQGRGGVLWAAHLGDFDLAASWLAQVLGIAPVVPIVSVPERWRQPLYAKVRQRCGFIQVPHDATRTELAGHLAKGRLVILMIDRRSARHSISVRLLGAKRGIGRAALALAAEADAPLVSAATFNRGGQRILRFGTVHSPGECRTAPAVVAQQVADELAAAIRSAPEQWHVPANRFLLPLAAPEIAPSPAWSAGTELKRSA